jgi:hypothetical protein
MHAMLIERRLRQTPEPGSVLCQFDVVQRTEKARELEA